MESTVQINRKQGFIHSITRLSALFVVVFALFLVEIGCFIRWKLICTKICSKSCSPLLKFPIFFSTFWRWKWWEFWVAEKCKSLMKDTGIGPQNDPWNGSFWALSGDYFALGGRGLKALENKPSRLQKTCLQNSFRCSFDTFRRHKSNGEAIAQALGEEKSLAQELLSCFSEARQKSTQLGKQLPRSYFPRMYSRSLRLLS